MVKTNNGIHIPEQITRMVRQILKAAVKLQLIFLLMAVAFLEATAQQDPVYGQYIFNSTIINPAQAGVFRQSQWGALYRNQWVGIDGAPITQSFFRIFVSVKPLVQLSGYTMMKLAL